MPQRTESGALALISIPALLLTESADEFNSLGAALAQEIKPRGIIEQMHVAETTKIVWETLRFAPLQSVHDQYRFPWRFKKSARAALEKS